jgi:hypothetical protein
MRASVCAAVCAGGLLVGGPLQAQVRTMVSVSSAGVPGDGNSGHAAMTPDGRYVAFVSLATDLVGDDTNGVQDVFVRDRALGVTTRVSVASDGTERAEASGVYDAFTAATDRPVAISADGRFVAFTSSASFVPEDVGTWVDIYRHDRVTGETRIVSVHSNGTPGYGPSSYPSLSGDGRVVAFASQAPNLVTGDTNGVQDVFVHDVLTRTTTRVSVASDGAESFGGSARPAITADGAEVAFASGSTTLVPGSPAGAKGFVHDRRTRTTTLILPNDDFGVEDIDISGDGSVVAIAGRGRPARPNAVDVPVYASVFDRTGRMLLGGGGGSLAPQGRTPSIDLSDDGRTLSFGPLVSTMHTPERAARIWIAGPPLGDLSVSDSFDISSGELDGLERWTLSGDGALCLTAQGFDLVAPIQVYVITRDADGDGMVSAWERFFGLDPETPNATADADGDGFTDLEEYQQGGNPTGGHVRFLAEAAANDFFATTLTIFNPDPDMGSAGMALRFLGPNGQVEPARWIYVPAAAARTVTVAPRWRGAFSAIVDSNLPVVVRRTMTWTGGGSHAATSVTAPSTTWTFAEGATHGGFDLFYLLLNPGATDANVDITFLFPAPAPPLVKHYVVPAHGRQTLWVDQEDPRLRAADVAATLVADQPIVAERSMYLSTAGVPFRGGHAGAGVATPSARWYFAEGMTGTFFDMFLTVANPSAIEVPLRLTYVRPSGPPIVRERTLAPRSRTTISVDDDPALADGAVAVIAEAVDGTPIVVERSMWWPSGDWRDGHVSTGAPAPSTQWALADGRVGGPANAETYVLLLNPTASAGRAILRLLDTSGAAPLIREIDLPPLSRVTVVVSGAFALPPEGASFSLVVDSSALGIVVEEAIYESAGGIVWSQGSAVVATPF